jgi:hypothetical protein
VDGVGADVDGAAGGEEVVGADAELGGEVPDAGVVVGAVVAVGGGADAAAVDGQAAEGGVLVVGPEEAAGALDPGAMRRPPAKFQRRMMGVTLTPVKVPPMVKGAEQEVSVPKNVLGM